MLLGQGTLARQIEAVLQQDQQCEALRHARRSGDVGGTEYTVVLPPNLEQLGMTFTVAQAPHGTHVQGTRSSRTPAAPARLLVDSLAPKGAAGRAGIAVGDELLRVCLLYTSPSPRDQRGSRMPSSA